MLTALVGYGPETFISSEYCKNSEIAFRIIEKFPDDLFTETEGLRLRDLAHRVLTKTELQVWYEFPEKRPRRETWLLGRIGAKEACRIWLQQHRQLEIQPEEIEILSDEFGKPVARWTDPPQTEPCPHISISHSRGVHLCAAGPRTKEIGLDFEDFSKRKVGDWLESAFAKSDLERIKNQHHFALTEAWCAKEAASKCLGTGLCGIGREWKVIDHDEQAGTLTIMRHSTALAVHIQKDDGSRVLAWCQAETSVVNKFLAEHKIRIKAGDTGNA